MVEGGDKMPDVRISLRTLRAELNVTQEKFAKLIEMPLSTYRKKEKGESPISLDEAYLIASMSNKSVEEIFFKTW
jgi:DNA-binding XRE family transcriptional regulator